MRPLRLACAVASCVFLLPGVAAAQTSGGGIGSASSAAGRYVDPGLNAGSTMGATVGTGTTTFSGGFSSDTGTAASGSSGTTDGDRAGDGDVGWRSLLLVVGGVFLVYALAGRATRLAGAAANAVHRRRGRGR
ncbi:hypothetical protein [Streptomyces phytophilus]|uniref:hypothetical protein n=1 Tax=Streptomyces phytophilus TaxID=722715 RepID=UPI0015F077A8|nr:hypothetical protein [Streptomyces phytophilus]